MRWPTIRGPLLVAAVAVAFCAAATQSAPQAPEAGQSLPPEGTVRGVVVNTANGKPVSQALVTLMDSSGQSSELTDEGGKFAFMKVSGSASLFAKKQGLLCALSESREKKCIQQIDILDPETRVTLELMPDAVIVGHIRSQRGVPIKQLGVTLMPIQDAQGAQLNAQGLSYVTTDEEGAFKFANLQPGSYLLRTSNAVDPDEAHPEPNTIDENVDHGYVATYYPDALDRANAKAIVVASGKSATVDLTLQNEKFQPVSVPYASDKVAATASIGWGLDCGGRDDQLYPVWDKEHHLFHFFAPNGSCKFEITAWPPSDANAGRPVPWRGSAEFTVAGTPIIVPEVQLMQPVTIPVLVKTEFTEQERLKAAVGPLDAYYPPSVTFDLRGPDSFSYPVGWNAGQPSKDIAFKDLQAGKYSLGTYGNDGVYAASLTCGDANLLSEPLMIEPGRPPCSIDAVLRDDSATVDVRISADGAKAMAASGVEATSLLLIPLDNAFAPAKGELFFKSDDPRTLKGLAPGRYLAVLSTGHSISNYRDPNELKKLMALGKVITLHAEERLSVLLDWVPGG